MRIFFFALLAGFLFSCNNANNDKKAAGSDTTQSSSTPQGSGPRAVADAIGDLQNTLQSGNKNSIADLFPFPLADTLLSVNLDDSTFSKSYRAAGDRLTKNLFLNYYDTIAKFSNLTDIIEGLRSLPVDSLKYKSDIAKEFIDKNSPCTRKYSITIEGDRVTLVYSTNFNKGYVVPKGSDSELVSMGCEYASFWIFRFDGNKLQFERQATAG